MSQHRREKSPFRTGPIRALSRYEQELVKRMKIFLETEAQEIRITLLSSTVSLDDKRRPLILSKEILAKIVTDHGEFSLENFIITVTDWDYVLRKIKGDLDRINMIRIIPEANDFLVLGAKRVNGFFILTYFEYASKYGNELKNLLQRGDALDRSGRTPESTTKLLRESDSVGSLPEAITVFRPDKENIAKEE